MISALLFDLDDTLLGNHQDVFIPAYFALLAKHLAGQADARRLVAEVMNGAQVMIAKTHPARPLAAAFNEYFYPAMGWEAETWAPRFDYFYRTHFSQLRAMTQLRPAARAIMEWAFAGGYQVVIATAPLFPLLAIQERLRWAGIDDFPYTLVTSMETSHFAKPHPEYLAEILARLGRCPEETLFVGDDWAADLQPAAALGMPHFWIAPAGSVPPEANSARPVGVGDLEAFWAWAKENLPGYTPPAPMSQALAYLLAGNLAAILGLVEDLPAADWLQRPGEKEWSLTEMVCHLRDVEMEVHWPRLQAVANVDNPFITGADTDPWAVERCYQAQSGLQALQDFVAARRQMCAFLSGLPETAWPRPARHAIFGPTHLAEMAGWVLDHDRIHLEQLRSTLERITQSGR